MCDAFKCVQACSCVFRSVVCSQMHVYSVYMYVQVCSDVQCLNVHSHVSGMYVFTNICSHMFALVFTCGVRACPHTCPHKFRCMVCTCMFTCVQVCSICMRVHMCLPWFIHSRSFPNFLCYNKTKRLGPPWQYGKMQSISPS